MDEREGEPSPLCREQFKNDQSDWDKNCPPTKDEQAAFRIFHGNGVKACDKHGIVALCKEWRDKQAAKATPAETKCPEFMLGSWQEDFTLCAKAIKLIKLNVAFAKVKQQLKDKKNIE